MSFIIDKISLTFKSHSYYQRLKSYHYQAVDIRKFFDDCNYQSRETGKINSYRHMAWAKVNDEGVVSVKYGRFRNDGSADYAFINVEYNPSKCTLPSSLISYLVAFDYKIYQVTSIDLAFDIQGITVNDVLFCGHASSQVMTFGTLGATSTKYLHPKVNHGRVKVYDKYAERLLASRKTPSIDPVAFKGVTRIEFTFHNVSFLLQPFYEELEVIKINDMFKYISQVMVKADRIDLLDGTIKENDRFVIDNFVHLGRVDLAYTYIRNKGVNQRAALTKYLRFSHFKPLYYNDLSSEIRFAEEVRNKVYSLLPSSLS